MTDISQLKTHADIQPGPVAPLTPSPFATYTNGISSLDGTIEDEESSTIRCICGYADDDGNTVLCERCDTWQHIVCYYGNPDNVPDVHECVHCTPRHVDTKSAAEMQRHLREINSKSEGRKRPPPKSTKKKVRDTPQAAVPLTNGWSSTDKADAPHQQMDRKSVSPRDQPPPAKRPKTSHRASISISGQIANPSLAPPARKRASSTLANGQSPVKSPTTPITNGNTDDYFSPEFMQLYRGPEFTPVDANSYTDTGIPNLLIEWLTDRDALAAVTGGSEPAQIYSRIDDPMEDLERSAPQLIQEMEEDPEVTIGGLHPIWRYLVSPVDLPSGGFIGELKGQIGRRQDYCSVPPNRWDTLRHPLPFVFFHPSLPLYIDTRHEGSVLRYVRRSCRPNLSISILITEERHYHFCLIAQSPIAAGDELTIGWEIDKSIHHSLNASVSNGNIRKDGLNSVGGLSRWAAGVLSNFGKCACHLPKGDCALERAIKRNKYYGTDANIRQIKTVAKTKKVKKSQTSPTGTGHAINSRAGSETVNRGEVDDNADTRSASGSSRSKPASRDITPMTHVSTDAPATVAVEMSDRERRKIMNLERQFEQMAYDEQQKLKKRTSGGSTLNTPGADITKQLGIVETSPSVSLPLIPALKSMGGEGPDARGSMSSRSGRPLVRANGPIPKVSPRPKLEYRDASTQTGDDQPRPPRPPIKRVFNIHLRRLLARCKLEREQQERLDQQRISRAQSSIVVGEAQQSSTQSPIPESMEPVDQGTHTDSPSVDPQRDQPTPAASMSENHMQSDGDETPTQPKPVVDSSATCTTENIVEEVMNDAPPESPKSESVPEPEVKGAEPQAAEQDVEMKDVVDAEDPIGAPSPTEKTVEMAPVSSTPPTTSSDPIPELEPSTQPSPPSHSATNESPAPEDIIADTTGSLSTLKPPLHVDLPPAFDLSATSSAVPLTPGSIVAQSPSSIVPPSIFSPSVASAATASPLRKKLSLSEFTSRRKRNMEAQSVATPTTNGSAGLNGLTPSLEVPLSSTVIVSSPLRETMSAGNSPAIISPSPSDSTPVSKSHPPPPLFNTSA